MSLKGASNWFKRPGWHCLTVSDDAHKHDKTIKTIVCVSFFIKREFTTYP